MNSPPILDAHGSLSLELDGISLIEASAGTGKTYTIANLYLRHILEGRSPSEILVVTFTNAATDELHQRIQARLYQAQHCLGQQTPPQDEFLALLLGQHRGLDPERQSSRLQLLQQALRSMDEAVISTIHGFCHSALQDHALLSNQPFEAEITTNDDDYWDRALKDWWRCNTYTLPQNAWSLFNQAIPSLQIFLRWQKLLRNHPQSQLLPQLETPLEQLLSLQIEEPADIPESLLAEVKSRALTEAQQYARRQVAAQKLADSRLAYQDQLDLLLAALQQDDGQLASRLRRRFPVAMIDEFQDTDPIQFGIFRQLYFDRQQTSLTLIGDPKQAIYGFRGGDIFTYIKARSEPSIRIYALQTNWRSQAGLVNAVNRIFGHRDQAFVFHEAIGFSPAQAASINDSEILTFQQQACKSLTIWQMPLRENGKTHTIGNARQMLNRALVFEISRLLDPQNNVRIGDRPIHKGDIAVLVRERDEGEEIRASLKAAGIASVSIGRDKVFESDEARGLYDLLNAIAYPADDPSLRRALASNLFEYDYRRLAEVIDDDELWQYWIDRLQELHRIWLNNGFITMFQQMLQALDLGCTLAALPSAERRLTNLLHIAEMLQQQSRRSPGIEALLGWFRRQLSGESGDEAELRLESDASLIKIVTIHKSKGLEYPVVFLPYLWRCRLVSKQKDLLRFHDRQQTELIDLGSSAGGEHACLAEKERLAEDLRLLYVALTRARTKVYMAWGDVGDGRSKGQPKHTALAYLLHSAQSPQQLEQALPSGFDDPAKVVAETRQFADSCDDIELTELPTTTGSHFTDATKLQNLVVKTFDRHLGPAWRISSFTGLTRDVHQVTRTAHGRQSGDSVLDFPAGSHIGLLLHELLEKLDFQQDIDSQGAILIPQLAPAYGVIGSDQQKVLGDWLKSIVYTRLDLDGLQLSHLSNHRRLNELKFDFAFDRFDVEAVNRLLQQGQVIPMQPINATDFRGMLTGIVDLIFEYRGKYYLADYKSNFLGASLDDYGPENLAQAMFDRRYDLQALLYSIALHRYLAQRLPNYRYESHFGGYYYLFLRAMRPSSAERYGVYYECPAESKINALERILSISRDQALVS